MTDLKPCPFCGGDKVWIRQIDMGKFHYAECQGCLAITTYHDTKAEAITAWNTRADVWIPVTERLPEKRVMVLVSGQDCHGEPVVVARQLTDIGWYDEGDEYSTKFVTHWMPLPLPPEVK